MQKSQGNQPATNAHRKVTASTTLSRKYVRRPETAKPSVDVAVRRSPAVKHFAEQQNQTMTQKARMADEPIQAATKHPLQVSANQMMRQRQAQAAKATVKRMTASELKDRAIKKALSEASRTKEPEEKREKFHFSFPRVALALSCAAAAVFAIVYFVNLNMPDLSLKVAAMQSGFDVSYPSYVPRDYVLTGIASEESKMTLSFENKSKNAAFSLKEEKSAWDSIALLNNFVKDAYGDDYTLIKEQGLTIYVSETGAAWVNGGIFYTIKVESGELTKKQIKSIAVSL